MRIDAVGGYDAVASNSQPHNMKLFNLLGGGAFNIWTPSITGSFQILTESSGSVTGDYEKGSTLYTYNTGVNSIRGVSYTSHYKAFPHQDKPL